MDGHLGFIGLGNMGRPMASRLIDAGYRLTVFDLRREAVDALRAKGAQAAASPAEVASAADTVLLSLPTPAIVREVALGENGVARGKTAKTLVDLSTTGARMAQEIAAALASQGIAAVDAPVSGGVAGAIKGTLAVMVACPRPRFTELEPTLKHLGKVFFIGERPGMGQTMKLANNLLSATALAATSEALVFGVKSGLDAQTMIDVLNAGSGRNSATQDKFPRAILPRTFDFGFTAGLMYKDLKLCMEEAEAAGVPMWIANAVRHIWFQLCNEVGGEQDMTRIVQLIEGWAGVQVKGGG
ncbi:MAG TPA: NAD(P)-dependent oxidoreductase [Myxococcaceae bacterium]|nr:NAD(P)-dependent oxidoreductase [Myxococcaceae bacterium]